jgi:REP element-mobilizing transposase RayT
MSKRTVPFIPDHYYHIYNKAVTDNKLFIEEKNYHFFISKIKKYLLDCVDVLAYCLMPNHYHLIIQLKNTDLPSPMQKLALSYSVTFNKSYQRTGHLFQGPYQIKHIGDLTYLLHLSRYIHLNPVTAKLVSKAEDWNYSSYDEYLGLRKPDFVKPMFILDQFSDENKCRFEEKQASYRRFVEDWNAEYMKFIFKE